MANNSGISNLGGGDFPAVTEEDFRIDPNDGVEPKVEDQKPDDAKVTEPENPKVTDPADKTPPKTDDKDPKDGDPEPKDGELFEDEEGNIIDKEGKIVVEKDKVEKDANGNVILPTKEEDQQIEKIVQSVTAKLGVELKDETGKVKTYPDTDEGLTQFVEDLADTVVAAREGAVFNEYPDLKNYLNHLMAGGKPDNYFKHVEETSTQKYILPADDKKDEVAQQTRKAIILEEQLIKNNYYNTTDANSRAAILARANKYVERVVDSGDAELLEEAKVAKSQIDNINEARRAAKAAADQANIQKMLDEQKVYIDTLKSTVAGKKLHSISIPDGDVQGFTDYLTKPITPEGKTAEMIDVAKEEITKSLEVAYLRYKGYNLNDLVSLAVNKEKAAAIRLRKAKPVSVTTADRKPHQGKANLDDITIDKLTI